MCHDSYHFHVTLLNMMEEQKCCPCLPDLPQTISNVDLSLYKIFDQTFEKIVSIFFTSVWSTFPPLIFEYVHTCIFEYVHKN